MTRRNTKTTAKKNATAPEDVETALHATSFSGSSLQKYMKTIADESRVLYEYAVNQGCGHEGAKLVDPTIWLMNQDIMRKSWEMFTDRYRHNKEMSMMIDPKLNSFAKYMTFMYDKYPVGFGEELSTHYRNGTVCDGEEIFRRLSNSIA